MEETPGFVASIDGVPAVEVPAAAFPSTAELPAAALPATAEMPAVAAAPTAPRGRGPGRRRRHGPRVMSRVLLAAIAAAFALYAAGAGSELLGLIRSASTRPWGSPRSAAFSATARNNEPPSAGTVRADAPLRIRPSSSLPAPAA